MVNGDLRLFICSLLSVPVLHMGMYADFDRYFIVSKWHLVPGMNVFTSLSFLLVIHRAWLIMRYLDAPVPKVLCFSFCMLMAWSLLGDPAAITSLKRHFQSEFEMKDLSFLRYFLALRLPTLWLSSVSKEVHC